MAYEKEVKEITCCSCSGSVFYRLFVLCDKYSENVKADYASQINPSIVNRERWYRWAGADSGCRPAVCGENGSEYGDKGLFSVSDSCKEEEIFSVSSLYLRRPHNSDSEN